MTRTVVASGHGGPEVLAVQDVVPPHPGPEQVLIDVRAAGTDANDYKQYCGQMGNDPVAGIRGRIATIAGFARAAGPGIAALTGADGGAEIPTASRPELLKLAGDGTPEVTVDEVLPLDDAPEAHRYLQTGHARGKVVLVP